MARVLEYIVRRLDLPPEAAAGTARITISGGTQVCIEQHSGLLSCSKTMVEVRCGRQRFRIRGDGLLLRVMNDELLLVTGTIFGVDVE